MLTLTLKSVVFLFLIAISVFDIRKMIIPDTFVVVVFTISLVFLVITKTSIDILYRFLFSFAVMGILFIVSKLTNGFGMGDVKLCSALSFAQGVVVFSISLAISSVAGILYYLLRYRREENRKIPFAPFLAAGFLLGEVVSGVIGI